MSAQQEKTPTVRDAAYMCRQDCTYAKLAGAKVIDSLGCLTAQYELNPTPVTERICGAAAVAMSKADLSAEDLPTHY